MEELIALGQKTSPYGGWILGRGWNQDLFLGEKRIPEKAILIKYLQRYLYAIQEPVVMWQ